jgi:5-methyltetrahydrofolate--homocysteine methyltransferase
VASAADYGIPACDVLIDPLAMPIGAEPRAALLFFETLRRIRDELGVNTTCGASNTSFGLPARHGLNAHFIATASTHGLTSAIMDARSADCVAGAHAADVLHARDEYGMAWIQRHRARLAAAK